MRAGGSPPVDDGPTAEWDEKHDTAVEHPEELDPTVLVELDADEVTPVRAPEHLPGYELGRRAAELAFFHQWEALHAAIEHRGVAKMLHIVRDHMLEDGAPPAIAEAIIQHLAKLAGVKLG